MTEHDASGGRTTHYVNARGRTVSLVEDPSLLAVKFKPGRTALAPQSHAFLAASAGDGAAGFTTMIPRYGVKLYRANARDPRVVALRRDPSVAFAGAAFRRSPESREVVVVLRRFHVGFRPEVTREEIDQLDDANGVQVVRQIEIAPNTFVLEGTGDRNGIELANLYRESELVAWAEPELIQRRATKAVVATPPRGATRQAAPAAAPRTERATTYLAKQWHLDKANVRNAWKTTRGSTSICIAILDDGVDVNHVEFKGKVIKQYDFSTDTVDGNPKSADDKHGTACAGVATAFGVRASGAAPNCRLMAIRTGDFATGSDEHDMFLWAADKGAHVISCSWGPPDDGTEFPLPELTRIAMDEITRPGGRGRKGLGIPIFFAAGNGNEDVMADGYASYERVMAIAASTSQDRKAEYSDFGPAICVCAPSNGFEADELGIVTTDRRGDAGYNPDPDATPEYPDFPDKNYCDNFGGTSSAAPLVAGIAALMLSVNPKLTPDQVRECLKQSARKLGDASDYDDAGHSDIYGHGCVDAAAALKLAKNPPAVSAPLPAAPKPPLITPVATSVSRSDAPPTFNVNPAPNTQYAIELATDPKLFDANANGALRNFCVNFFATWDKRAVLPRFFTTPQYQVPAAAWNGMKGASALYYRALTCTDNSWGNYKPTLTDSDAAKAPWIQITAERSVAHAARSALLATRPALPTILGPDAADPAGPPPTFTVTPGSAAFFGVEVATEAALFDVRRERDRRPSNFYGSWERALLPSPETARAEGTTTYTLPLPAWKRLHRAARLYYRAFAAPAADAGEHEFRYSAPGSDGAQFMLLHAAGGRGERTALRGAAAPVAPIASTHDDDANWKRPTARDDSGGGAPARRTVEANVAHGRTARAPAHAPARGAAGGAALRYELGPVPARPFRAPVFTGDYPGSLRFIQAKFYTPFKATTAAPRRQVTGIVIHITDGPQKTALGIAAYFKDPRAADGSAVQASAHYVVGQAGEIVQCVRETDVAYHAHDANAWSIGIEHCANTRGMGLTDVQYASSAALVRWLCDRYGIALDRKSIRGHAEADPKTTHTQCPGGAKWDWAYYMDMVVNAMSRPR